MEDLCAKVFRATEVKPAMEGVYHWILLPSRQDPKRPVATRYFGVFADGSLKVRGLCAGDGTRRPSCAGPRRPCSQ